MKRILHGTPVETAETEQNLRQGGEKRGLIFGEFGGRTKRILRRSFFYAIRPRMSVIIFFGILFWHTQEKRRSKNAQSEGFGRKERVGALQNATNSQYFSVPGEAREKNCGICLRTTARAACNRRDESKFFASNTKKAPPANAFFEIGNE